MANEQNDLRLNVVVDTNTVNAVIGSMGAAKDATSQLTAATNQLNAATQQQAAYQTQFAAAAQDAAGASTQQTAAVQQQAAAVGGLAARLQEVADADAQRSAFLSTISDENKQATKDTYDFIDALREEAEAKRNADGGDGGGKLSGISSFRSLSSIAAIAGGGEAAQPIRLLGDFARLKDTLPALASSAVEAAGGVGQLGLALGLASAAVVAILVVIKLFAASIEAGKKSVEAAIAAQEYYQQVVATMTTEQAKAARDQLEIQRQAILNTRDVLVNSLKGQDFSNPETLIAAQPVLDAIGKYNTALGANQDQIDGLTTALGNNSLALNDAIEANKKQAELNVQLANDAKQQYISDQQLLTATKAGDAQSRLDSAQSQARAAELAYQGDAVAIARLQANGDTTKTTTDAISAAMADLSKNLDTYLDLVQNVIPVVQAQADAEFQLEARRQGLLALSGEMVTAEQDAAKAQKDYLKALQDNNDGIIAARVKLSEATDKALQSMNDSIAAAQQAADDASANAQRSAADAKSDAAQTAEDARTSAQTKAQDARVQAEKDYQEKLKQIEQTYQLAAETAIQDRDAVALDAAQTQRQNDITNATDAEKQKLADIDKNLKEQLATIDKRYKEQIAQIDRRLQEQNADIARRLSEQVATAKQKYGEAVAAAEAAYAKTVTDLQNNLTALQAIRDQAFAVQKAAEDAFLAYAQTWANNLTTTGASIGSGTTTGTGGGGTPSTPTPFAAGGFPPVGRTVRVGENGPELVRFLSPARVFNAAQTRAGAGSSTFTLNLNGATLKTIDIRSRAQAHREFSKILDAAGVD